MKLKNPVLLIKINELEKKEHQEANQKHLKSNQFTR